MKLILTHLLMLLFFIGCSQENKKPSIVLVLSNVGVNSLDSKTLFSQSEISSKLLSYNVEIFTARENGVSVSVMRVLYNSREVMIITPTIAGKNAQQYIKNISITSDYIENPFNMKIGDSYNKNAFSTCQELQETLICKQKEFNNIELHFKKDLNQKWSLKEILWNAHA